MHYLSAIWNILDLLGSIATVLVCVGLLTGRLELRRPRPEAPVRTIIVNEAPCSPEGAALSAMDKFFGGAR